MPKKQKLFKNLLSKEDQDKLLEMKDKLLEIKEMLEEAKIKADDLLNQQNIPQPIIIKKQNA
jgi:hypothetical protein